MENKNKITVTVGLYADKTEESFVSNVEVLPFQRWENTVVLFGSRVFVYNVELERFVEGTRILDLTNSL